MAPKLVFANQKMLHKKELIEKIIKLTIQNGDWLYIYFDGLDYPTALFSLIQVEPI